MGETSHEVYTKINAVVSYGGTESFENADLYTVERIILEDLKFLMEYNQFFFGILE